ncbi:MAG TPA: laccase domain-containing protein [Allosphingosinicella sp.]|jgi:copper oxidase (laccase) domain-containing protein
MAWIKKVEGFKLVFSTIDDGNMARTQKTREEVHENRRRFLSAQVPTACRVIRVRPSHSVNIDVAHPSNGDSILQRTTFFGRPRIDTDFDFYYDGADGVIATDANTCLSLIAGDCAPLLFWSSRPRCFGILHIGLLGALNNMVAGLERALASIDLTANDLSYYLGPSITQADYDISKSGLWTAIEGQARSYPQVMDELRPYLNEEMYFDMKGMIRMQLAMLGVSPSKIDEYPLSTADPKAPFYSHYVAIQQGGTPQNFCCVLCPTA